MSHAEAIKNVSPWFFNIRSLIGERPNIIPAGIGNNTSGYDTSILLPSSEPGEPEEGELSDAETVDSSLSVVQGQVGDPMADNTQEGVGSEGVGWAPFDDTALEKMLDAHSAVGGLEGAMKGSDLKDDLDGLDVKTEKKAKRKASLTDSEPDHRRTIAKKTPARPGPVATAAIKHVSKKPKPLTQMEQFNAVAQLEEETAQRKIDLRKAKMQGSTSIQIANIKAQTDVRLAKDNGKLEIKRLKLIQEHELKMARECCIADGANFSFDQNNHHTYSSSRAHRVTDLNFGHESTTPYTSESGSTSQYSFAHHPHPSSSRSSPGSFASGSNTPFSFSEDLADVGGNFLGLNHEN